MAGIFDQVGSAEETQKSGYFYPGLYLVELQEVKHLTRSGEKIVIEAKVVAAKSDDDRAPEPGETRAHFISGFGDVKRGSMALGDLKKFTRAVYGPGAGCDAWTDQQWAQAAQAIVGTRCKGVVLKLECFMNAAGTFTIHRWWGHASACDYAEFGLQAPAA